VVKWVDFTLGEPILLHILIGDDDYSILQALREILKSAGDAEAVMSNTTVLEGPKVTPEQLRAACETVPFLADKRLVVIEGLLARFEAKSKPTKKKTKNVNTIEETIQKIAAGIKNLPPFTELVLMDAGVTDKNPLLQAIGTAGKLRMFPVLKGPALAQWVDKQIASLSKNGISLKASALLVRLVGSDLWTMSNELEKLVSYAGGKKIEEADVKAVVSNAQEAGIFAMIDAILEQRVGAAQEMLQQLFNQGMAPAQILVMLSRQVRIIFLMKEMRSQGKSRTEIQNKLGLRQDFVLRKAWDQADRYTPSRIRELYHLLLETDIAIKTGKLDGELALDVLVAEFGLRSVPVSAGNSR
jgi:DNA polymerase III subunit delta